MTEARLPGRAQDLAGDVPGAGGKRRPRTQAAHPGWTFTTLPIVPLSPCRQSWDRGIGLLSQKK